MVIPSDHPHRRLFAQLEHQAAEDITAALDRLRRDLFRDLRRENVTEIYIRLRSQEVNERLRQGLYTALLPAVEAAVENEKRRLERKFGRVKALGGIGFSWDLVAEAARRVLWQHSFLLVYANEFSITEATARGLRSAIDDFIITGDMTMNQLSRRVEELFDVVRGEMIAVTEVTRVYAHGQQTVWREAGIIEKQRWNTAVDELVCPICAPLNGKVVGINEAWARYIDSPPAHPLCRCWVTPVIDDEDASTESDERETDDGIGEKKRQEVIKLHDQMQEKRARIVDEKRRLSDELDSLFQEREKWIARALGESYSYADRDAFIARNKAEWQAWQNKILDLQDRVQNLADRLLLLLREQQSMYVDLLAVDRPNSTRLLPMSAFSDNDLKTISEANNYFNRLVSEELTRNLGPHGRNVGVYHTPGGRAYASGSGIFINENESAFIILHELGHVLESNNRNIMTRLQNFYEKRTKNEPAVPLSSVAPSRGYGDDEITKVDDFMNPYMGKVYVDSNGNYYAFEILSMGLEYMLRNPYELATKDPEMFALVYNIISGN